MDYGERRSSQALENLAPAPLTTAPVRPKLKKIQLYIGVENAKAHYREG